MGIAAQMGNRGGFKVISVLFAVYMCRMELFLNRLRAKIIALLKIPYLRLMVKDGP
jgi:hypothetical protein